MKYVGYRQPQVSDGRRQSSSVQNPSREWVTAMERENFIQQWYLWTTGWRIAEGSPEGTTKAAWGTNLQSKALEVRPRRSGNSYGPESRTESSLAFLPQLSRALPCEVGLALCSRSTKPVGKDGQSHQWRNPKDILLPFCGFRARNRLSFSLSAGGLPKRSARSSSSRGLTSSLFRSFVTAAVHCQGFRNGSQ